MIEKRSPVLLCLLAVLLTAGTGFASENKKPRATFPLAYEGGNLPLHHDRVTATLAGNELLFAQHRRRISVPAGSITRISCGSEARRKFMDAVLDRVPLVHLGDAGSRYVGVTWQDANHRQVEVLFRVSKDDYGNFVAALERLTGIAPVDTNRVPAVVRYQL